MPAGEYTMTYKKSFILGIMLSVAMIAFLQLTGIFEHFVSNLSRFHVFEKSIINSPNGVQNSYLILGTLLFIIPGLLILFDKSGEYIFFKPIIYCTMFLNGWIIHCLIELFQGGKQYTLYIVVFIGAFILVNSAIRYLYSAIRSSVT
jgi:hypothetical protein